MSWLTDFLTPNDARRPKAPQPTSPSPSSSSPQLPSPKRILDDPPSTTTPAPSDEPKPKSTSIFPEQTKPHRPRLLLFAGSVFFLASLVITRRALARKRALAKPAYYTNSLGHTEAQSRKTSGAMEALEALNLATINVLSVAMMAVGGGMWWFGVEGVEDLRGRVRGSIQLGSGEGEVNEREREFEEYLAGILGGKREEVVVGKEGGEGARLLEEGGSRKEQGKGWREQAREEFERERRR